MSAYTNIDDSDKVSYVKPVKHDDSDKASYVKPVPPVKHDDSDKTSYVAPVKHDDSDKASYVKPVPPVKHDDSDKASYVKPVPPVKHDDSDKTSYVAPVKHDDSDKASYVKPVPPVKHDDSDKTSYVAPVKHDDSDKADRHVIEVKNNHKDDNYQSGGHDDFVYKIDTKSVYGHDDDSWSGCKFIHDDKGDHKVVYGSDRDTIKDFDKGDNKIHLVGLSNDDHDTHSWKNWLTSDDTKDGLLIHFKSDVDAPQGGGSILLQGMYGSSMQDLVDSGKIVCDKPSWT